MRPDLSTFTVLPHVERQARVICDMEYSDGRPVEASPRRVLQRQVERGGRAGADGPDAGRVRVLPPRRGRRGSPPFGGTDITTTLTNQRLPVLQQLVRDLQALRPVAADAQPGVGADAVRAHLRRRGGARRQATTTSRTRRTRRRSPAQHGLIASFMTKPFVGPSGSSSHLHMSLLRRRSQHLLGRRREGVLTQEFHWAIGGLLEHAAALNAFLGPTVNCAKRYRKGTYAPASVTWGFENRSVAVRVKAGARRPHPRRESARARARRTRTSRFAGMLVAMLDGIERQIEPPDAAGDERLPARRPRCSSRATLEESLEALRGATSPAQDAFHPEFVQGVPGPQAPRDRRRRARRYRATAPTSGTTR